MRGDDVAILHDRLQIRGGAERVAFEIAREFDAPIYAGLVDDDVVPDDIESVELFGSQLDEFVYDHLPPMSSLYKAIRWSHVDDVWEFDTLIQTKEQAAWLMTSDDQTVVRYVHTPPRWMYDRWHSRSPGIGSRAMALGLRALHRGQPEPTLWIANSDVVAKRASRAYGVDPDEIRVIYPPVETSGLSARSHDYRDDYYVTIGRLRSHKRTEEIIRVCNETERRLVVAGDGPQRDYLEGIAGPTVDLVGYVSEAEKRRLLQEARGFIFAAAAEDFGIVPIEAMAAGCPVIGINDGFTQHQIIERENGLRYERGDLAATLDQFEETGVRWSARAISHWTQLWFSTDRFGDELSNAVDEAERRDEVSPPWKEVHPAAAALEGGDHS